MLFSSLWKYGLFGTINAGSLKIYSNEEIENAYRPKSYYQDKPASQSYYDVHMLFANEEYTISFHKIRKIKKGSLLDCH